MALMTSIREKMQVVLWTLLALFLLSMTLGGLVGGANIIDQIFGKDKSCMTRIIQKLVTFIFNKNRYPCHVKEIEEFAKKNGIINSDGRHMKWTRDLTEFTSIDDFFTRRPAVLPPASLLSQHNLTSPCEGTVVGYETIEAAQRFWIKQKSFCLNSVGIPREFLHNFHNMTHHTHSMKTWLSIK